MGGNSRKSGYFAAQQTQPSRAVHLVGGALLRDMPTLRKRRPPKFAERLLRGELSRKLDAKLSGKVGGGVAGGGA